MQPRSGIGGDLDPRAATDEARRSERESHGAGLRRGQPHRSFSLKTMSIASPAASISPLPTLGSVTEMM